MNFLRGTNHWLIAAAVLLVALLANGIVVFTRKTEDRLVGLEMAGVLEVLILVLVAQGINRASMLDMALAMALLAFGGGLVFARFLERWL